MSLSDNSCLALLVEGNVGKGHAGGILDLHI